MIGRHRDLAMPGFFEFDRAELWKDLLQAAGRPGGATSPSDRRRPCPMEPMMIRPKASRLTDDMTWPVSQSPWPPCEDARRLVAEGGGGQLKVVDHREGFSEPRPKIVRIGVGADDHRLLP